MKIITTRKIILDAINIASKAVGKSIVIPILDYLLFEINNDQVAITGSSSDLFITATIDIEPCGFKHSVAIPKDTLSELINGLPESPIAISFNKHDNNIEISAGFGEYKMSGEEAEDFPRFEHGELTSVWLPGTILKSGIEKVLFATGADHLRPAMTGVYLKFEKDQITFSATDAFKVSTHSFPIKSDLNTAIVATKKMLNALEGMGMDEQVEMLIGDNKMKVKVSSKVMIGGVLIDERYPDYESVIPRSANATIEVDRMGLIGTLNRLSAFSNKQLNTVKLSFENNILLATADDQDFGKSAKEEIPCDSDGEMVIGFNHKYLLGILKKMESEAVHFYLTSSNRAAVIREEKTSASNTRNLMLLMPTMLSSVTV